MWEEEKRRGTVAEPNYAPLPHTTMSGNSSAPALPPSLALPPHLSAQKYFFVCTLTIAAWDALVLSPRAWRLLKTPGWPPLKLVFHALRFLLVVELVATGERAAARRFSSVLMRGRRCVLRHGLHRGGESRPRCSALVHPLTPRRRRCAAASTCSSRS
jgi:hypothetical protein